MVHRRGVHRVGWVGRISPEKQLGLLLHAMAQLQQLQQEGLQQRRHIVRLVVVGGGAGLEAARALAQALRLPEVDASTAFSDSIEPGTTAQPQVQATVTFLGHLPRLQLPSVLQRLHVFASVCPETFGLGAVEAMAMELPVLSFAATGPSEYMRDGVNGIVLQSAEPSHIAQQLWQLLSDPATAAVMGRAARATVVEGINTLAGRPLTTAAMVAEYAALYERLYQQYT